MRKFFLNEAKRLIRFRSVTTDSNGAIACYVGRLLKKEGFKVHTQTERIGGALFSNVIGVKGKGTHPLILMTHLDTVPPGPHPLWTKTEKNPWNPVIRKGCIYGLGSADTKLDILPKIFASRNVSVPSMKRPLWIVGTFGEERGLLGARTFCRRLKRQGGIAFVSEPSQLTWVHEHRGYLVLEVSIPLRRSSEHSATHSTFELKASGKSAHSSTPRKGRNAVRLSFEILTTLSRRDPSLKVLYAEGGSSPNQVPSFARFVFSTRLSKFPSHPYVQIKPFQKGPRFSQEVPWGAVAALFEAVDQGIQKRKRSMTSNVGVVRTEKRFFKVLVDFRVHPKDKNREALLFFKRIMNGVLRREGLRASFRVERDGPPLSVSAQSPIVRLARRVSREAALPFRLAKKPSCTEAGYLWQKGIPALVFGPGKSLGNIHAPNEYNELSQLEKAVKVYRALIERYCVRRGLHG